MRRIWRCILTIAVLILMSSLKVWAAPADAYFAVVNDTPVISDNVENEIRNGIVYVPIRALGETFGAEIGWNPETGRAYIKNKERKFEFALGTEKAVYMNGMRIGMLEDYYIREGSVMVPFNDIMIMYGYKPQNISDMKIARVVNGNQEYSEDDIRRIFGEIAIEHSKAYYEKYAINPLADGHLKIGDTYRVKDYNIQTYGPVKFVGDAGYEILRIGDVGIENYAEILNKTADLLPDVRVLSAIVPTPSEFYAPKNIYISQLDAISGVYDNLHNNVIPVNVIEALYNHCDEKIFFRTDHHWTQRGAYYAYEQYMRTIGGEVPDIDKFECLESNDFVGSWGNYLSGFLNAYWLMKKINNSPELLEIFIPDMPYVGYAYSDGYMREFLSSVNVVYPEQHNYSTFIGGDRPVTVFRTACENDKSVCVIKDSYGNAFSTWLINNYSTVYVIDPRCFNSAYWKESTELKIKKFYDLTKFDDLVFVNYTYSVESVDYRDALERLVN